MLVLSRKVGERLVIADNIVVEVLEVRGRQIRLGVQAPAEVEVWREERLRPPGGTQPQPCLIRPR